MTKTRKRRFISTGKNIGFEQGHSQPHSPGWARVPLSYFFPQILINFSSNFTIFFLILALRVGESPTREGPGYATEFERENMSTITCTKNSNSSGFIFFIFFLFFCFVLFCFVFFNADLYRTQNVVRGKYTVGPSYGKVPVLVNTGML